MTSLTQIRREREGSLDLQQLAAELVAKQKTKLDYVADTRRVGFYTEGGQSFVTIDGVEGPADGFKLRDHAHMQLATKLGIPKRYYDRMRDAQPGLLDSNVTTWLVQEPERRMFRTLDGELRAYLSDRYRRLDNFDLMERGIIPAFKDVDGLQFHVANLTPETLHIRAILPTVEREVRVGDIVQAGVQITNSEVGLGACRIDPFVWRLDCLNGMVSRVGRFQAYHVGKRIEETEEAFQIFAADTMAADDKAFYLKARDAIKAVLSEERFDEVVAGLKGAAESEPAKNPVKATEALQTTFDLSETEGTSLLTSLIADGDLTRWGFANAVTNAAKSAETFGRQEELETLGSVVATMAEAEWSKIAALV